MKAWLHGKEAVWVPCVAQCVQCDLGAVYDRAVCVHRLGGTGKGGKDCQTYQL